MLSISSAIAWTTAGSIVGAVALYWLGAALGHDRQQRIWARLPLVDDDDLSRTTIGSTGTGRARSSRPHCWAIGTR